MIGFPTEQEQEFEAMLTEAIESNQPLAPTLLFRHGGQEELEAMIAEAMDTPMVPESNTATPQWGDSEVIDESRTILSNGAATGSGPRHTIPQVDERTTLEALKDYFDLTAEAQDDQIKELRDEMFKIVDMIVKAQKRKETELQERILKLEAQNELISTWVSHMAEIFDELSASRYPWCSTESSDHCQGPQQ